MKHGLVLGFLMASLLGSTTFAAQSPQSVPSKKGQKSSVFESGIEIDRIDINGVKIFSSDAIGGALAISPGDKLERLKVVKTEESLQTLYRSHGYEQVSIRSRLVRKKNEDKTFETVLEFSITEGKPVRIAEIQILPAGIEATGKEPSRAWQENERSIRARLGLAAGDIFDQEKVADSKRAIQELLASEEYIGAKVTSVQSVTRQPPADSASVSNEDVARWVTVQFRVDMGDKVSFGFRGNTVFTRGYLDGVVDELRLVGLGKDYVGAVRSRIEEEYHGAGYARVGITTYTTERPDKNGRKVTYAIQEGPRVQIASVDFDGNSVFSSEVLREKFYSKASGIVQHNVYAEKDVHKAAELVIEWMKEKGYLAAKVVTINAVYLPKLRTQQTSSAVRLVVYLYEGDQTLVKGFSAAGNKLLDSRAIQKVLRVEEGKPLNLFAFGEGLDALKKTYRDRGYLGFRILNEGTESVIEYSQENRLADINLEIDEGDEYRVSRVEIEGLVKTKEEVVRRELAFREGEVLGEGSLIESERLLKRLGIFSSVTIRPTDDPNRPGYKVVRISISEADRGILAWGPGIRNDLGVRLFGQLSYTNLWGLNHTVSVNASVNRRFSNYQFVEGQVQFSYLWPWFWIPDLTFRPAFSVAQTQYYYFSATSLVLSAVWEKPLLSQPNLVGNIGYTLEKITQFNTAPGGAGGNNQLLIGTITPRLTLDLRDNPLAPTRGLFVTSWADFAYPFFGSEAEINYYRLQFRVDYHLSLFRKVNWYLSFRTGYENNTATTGAIPLIKQFALGGIGSLRGWQEQQLNYQTTPIYGSLSYVNYRSQWDFPFSGALRLGLFVDAANLIANHFSLGGLWYGAGFGFHYQTPVGPINLDWGFKVDPPPGLDPYVLHFSVGVI